LGLSVAVTLSGGQVSDVKGYAPVMDERGPTPRVLLADKLYDADFIRDDLTARGVTTVIPAKRNRKVLPVIDGHIYALRNLIERCFSKLKHSRRLATRYDKTADSFLGFVLVASIRLWDQAPCPHHLSQKASSEISRQERKRAKLVYRPSLG
jgi:transposase